MRNAVKISAHLRSENMHNTIKCMAFYEYNECTHGIYIQTSYVKLLVC